MISITQFIYEGKHESALLHRIKSNLDDKSIGGAIAIAKTNGLIQQDGSGLKLTEKGKQSAKKAIETLKSEGYKYDSEKDRWVK